MADPIPDSIDPATLPPPPASVGARPGDDGNSEHEALLASKGYPPQVAPDPPFKKPAQGAPCTHCGQCCLSVPCELSQAFFKIDEAQPCPALLWTYGGSRCGLVQEPAMFAPTRARIYGATRMREAAKRLLGSGRGCYARYMDEAPNEAFKASVRKRREAQRKLLLLDQRIWGIKIPPTLGVIGRAAASHM